MGKVSQRTVSPRLGREDWILAGFRALVRGGQAALRVEPVARDIGATKGSFYWHFADPGDWHKAMLAYWEDRAFSAIVAALEPVAPGEARLRGVIGMAVANRDPGYGGAMAEPALRDWARYDGRVAAAVIRVDQARVDWLAAEFRAAGCTGDVALPLYAALVGLAAMNSAADQTSDSLNRLLDALLLRG
jgi:AcrR family transcriptional regulator